MIRQVCCFLIIVVAIDVLSTKIVAERNPIGVVAYLPTYHPGPRQLSPVLLDSGWHSWLRFNADAAVRLGYTRILVHLPFGDIPNEHYRLGAYLDCLEDPRTTRVASEFVTAWRDWRIRNPEISVTFYVGPAFAEPRLKNLRDQDREAWLETIHKCIEPILAVEANLCLDAQVFAQKGSQGDECFDVIKQLMSTYQGKLGVEGWPLQANPRYARVADFIVVSSPPDLENKELIPISQVSCETIIIDQSSKWQLNDGLKFLRDGYSVAVNPLAGDWRHRRAQSLQ